MLIMSLISLLFVVLGILIKYFKWYWLISGYNTMSPEKKKNVDAQGLGKFIGNSMFVIAGIFLLGVFINSMGYVWGIAAASVLMVLYIICILIAAQKYDHNKKAPKDRVILIVVITFLVMVLGSTAALMYSGSRPVQVEITSEHVGIKGAYGITIPVSRIRDISLKDSMPEVLAKTNGFNAGGVLKGNFRVEDLGDVKLFVQSEEGRYVYIVTADGNTVIINYRDEQLTRELYEKLMSVTLDNKG